MQQHFSELYCYPSRYGVFSPAVENGLPELITVTSKTVQVCFGMVRAMVSDCFSLEPAWFERNLKLEPLTKQGRKPLYSERFIDFIEGSRRFVREPFRNKLEPPRNAAKRHLFQVFLNPTP